MSLPIAGKVHGGLLGWWKLDGNAEDTSGNGFHGTVSGATVSSSGKIGQCYQFTNGNRILISSIDLPATAAITAWGYMTNSSDKQMLFSCDSSAFRGPDLYFTSGYIHWNTGDSSSNPFLLGGVKVPYPSLNTWHHYAVINDASAGKAYLYIDGNYKGEANYRSTFQEGRGFVIGNYYPGSTSYAWRGRIDDVRIYDRALSAKEIKELAKGKILHYKFDTHQDGVIQDASGFGYHSRVDAASSPSWSSDSSLGSGAYDFRPTSTQNNIIRIPGVPGDFDSFTLTAWIKPRSTGVFKHIVGWAIDNNSNRSMILNHNKLAFHDYSTYGADRDYPSVSDVVTLGSWQFCAVTYNRGTIKVYHNGVLVGQHQGQLNPATGDLIIGSPVNNISDWSRAFDGLIDDVRIYATALSDEDVKELYQQRTSIDSRGNVFVHELVEAALTSGLTSGLDASGRMKSEFVSEVGVVEGLLAWYPLQADVLDLSGSKNHITVNGPLLSSVSGRFGLFFDGVDDWAQIAQPVQFPESWNSWTITGWIYPTQSGWIISPRSSGNDHGIIYDGSNRRLRFFITRASDVGNRSRYSLNESVPLNQWSHFACSLDGLLVRIYINGELQYEDTETDPIALWSGAWDLGRRGTAASYFGGYLSDLRIYRRPLTAQEVGILYKATRSNPVLMQQTADGLYIAGQFIEV